MTAFAGSIGETSSLRPERTELSELINWPKGDRPRLKSLNSGPVLSRDRLQHGRRASRETAVGIVHGRRVPFWRAVALLGTEGLRFTAESETTQGRSGDLQARRRGDVSR